MKSVGMSFVGLAVAALVAGAGVLMSIAEPWGCRTAASPVQQALSLRIRSRLVPWSIAGGSACREVAWCDSSRPIEATAHHHACASTGNGITLDKVE
jgi:hypothetical protein